MVGVKSKNDEMMKNLRYLMIVVTAAFLSACGKDDAFDNGNRELILASQTEAIQTRATVDNTWDGGEHVQVSINNGAAVTFIAASNGTLTPVDPLYWYSSSQTLSVRAWYPALWVFPVDQSGGPQAADFLFAPTVSGITFHNVDSKLLTFYHRTAKVAVNLTAGTGVGGVAGATVAFYGYTSGVPDTSDTGNGTISGFGNGWITPQYTGSNSHAALLIPRDMAGVSFVKITLDGFDYLYTPSAGDADLQQGCFHTYNITVHKTRLEVTVGNGITWDAGDDYTVIADVVEN